jgi:hypothetical protein
MFHPNFVSPLRLSAAALLAAIRAHAATIVDDFNDGNDTGWTRYSPFSGFGAPASFTFPGGTTTMPSPAPGVLGAPWVGSYGLLPKRRA